ncbi:hypothetical protein JTE90_029228 [Oedothorax gibbosus]|uniref:Fibronectin type-III domain-containing protein n=1 Tax=Oedothorax gibbosus TaxID=931172 RepID=A0AAV6VEA2_9ARAC|nr:hypothetical protein JTE90_029228 [Oedothorax gibbosus]
MNIVAQTVTGPPSSIGSGETTGTGEKTGIGDISDNKKTTISKVESTESTDGLGNTGETTDNKEESGKTASSGEKSGDTSVNGETTEGEDSNGKTTDDKENSSETTENIEINGETTDVDDKSGETTNFGDESGETTDVDDESGETTDVNSDDENSENTNVGDNGETTASAEITDSDDENSENTNVGDNGETTASAEITDSDDENSENTNVGDNGEMTASAEITDSDDENGETTDSKETNGDTADVGDKSGETTDHNESSDETTVNGGKSGETTDEEVSGDTTDSKGKSSETIDNKEKEDKSGKNKNKESSDDELTNKNNLDESGDTNNANDKNKGIKKKSYDKRESKEKPHAPNPEYDIEHEMYYDEENEIEKIANNPQSASNQTSANIMDPEYDIEHELYYDDDNDKTENAAGHPLSLNQDTRNFANKSSNSSYDRKRFNTMWKNGIKTSENETDQKLVDLLLENESLENNEIDNERHRIVKRALPSLLPGSPGKPVITRHNDKFHLTWLPPSNKDELDIENYIVEVKIHHSDWEVIHETGDPRTECIIPMPKVDKPWKVRVVAVNKYGEGKPSLSESNISEENPLDIEGMGMIQLDNSSRKVDEDSQHGMDQSRQSSERFGKEDSQHGMDQSRQASERFSKEDSQHGMDQSRQASERFSKEDSQHGMDQSRQSSERFSKEDSQHGMDQWRQSSERFGKENHKGYERPDQLAEHFTDGNEKDFERIDSPVHSEEYFTEGNKQYFDEEANDEEHQSIQARDKEQSDVYENTDNKNEEIGNNLQNSDEHYDYPYSKEKISEHRKKLSQYGPNKPLLKNLEFSEVEKIHEDERNSHEETELAKTKSIGQGDEFSEEMHLYNGQFKDRIELKSLKNENKGVEFAYRDQFEKSDDNKVKRNSHEETEIAKTKTIGQGDGFSEEMHLNNGQFKDGIEFKSLKNENKVVEFADRDQFEKSDDNKVDNTGRSFESVDGDFDDMGQKQGIDGIFDYMGQRGKNVDEILESSYSDRYSGENVENLSQYGKGENKDLDNIDLREKNVDQTGVKEEYVDKIGAEEEDVDKISKKEEDVDKIGEKEDVDKIGAKEEDADKIGANEDDGDKIGAKEEDVDKIGAKEEDVDKIGAKEEDVDKIGAKEEDVDKIGAKEEDVNKIGTKEEDVDEIVDKRGPEKEKVDETVGNVGPREEDFNSSEIIDNTSQNKDYVEKIPKNELSDKRADREFDKIDQVEEDVDENSSSTFQNTNFKSKNNKDSEVRLKRNIRSNVRGHGMDVNCWSSAGGSDKEECMENAGRKVMHKCVNVVGHLPEFSSLEHVLGSIGKAYERNKNVTQICIQEVFDRCSYDTNFRIKMKAVNTIGVSLDIDFIDEFEMDKCTRKSVQRMLSAIETCYQGEIHHVQTAANDTVQQILNEAAYCVEDHTAYTCVIDNQKLFRDTMAKLIDCDYILLSKPSTDQMLNFFTENVKNYKETRLCLVYLDYFRAENCEKDFYLYVQCLANGTNHYELYEKVLSCFENAYKHCPKGAIKALIKMLAGAVGGRGGYQWGTPAPGAEDSQDNFALENFRSGDQDTCTSKIIAEYKHEYENCFKTEQEKNKRKNYNMCIYNFGKCLVKNMLSCRIHKYSSFENLSKHIFEMRDHDCKTKDGSCKPTDFKTIEPCMKLLFQAYVTLHHIHYNKEGIPKQLEKAGLCLYSNMKPCEKKLVDKFLGHHAKPLNLAIPENYEQGAGAIRTSVTLPNENVVCSTRFFSLPTTFFSEKNTPKTHHYPITRSSYHQRRFPTTKRYTRFNKAPERIQDLITQPATRRAAYRPPMRRYTDVMRPSPVRHHGYELTENVNREVLPGVTPRFHARRPIGGSYTQIIQPTETYTQGVYLPTRRYTAGAYVPQTVTRWHFPGPVRYGYRITPTKIYSRRHTPPVESIDQDFGAPVTQVQGYRPQDQREYHYHIPKPKPSLHKVKPPKKYHVSHHDVPPTEMLQYPAPTKVIIFKVTPVPGAEYIGTAPSHHIHIRLPPHATRKVKIPPKRPLPQRAHMRATTLKHRRYPINVHVIDHKRPLTTARVRVHHMHPNENLMDEDAPGTTKTNYVPKNRHYHYYIDPKKGSSTKFDKIMLPTKRIVSKVPAVPTQFYVHNRWKKRPQKPQRYHYHVQGSNYTEIIHVRTPRYRVYTPADHPGVSEHKKWTTGMLHFHQPNIRYGTKVVDFTTSKSFVHPRKRRTRFDHILPTKVYTRHVHPITASHAEDSPQASTQIYKSPKCEKVSGWIPVTGKNVDMNQLIQRSGGHCKHPFAIECHSGHPDKKHDKVTCDIHSGFCCEGNCQEYKVRLMCCNDHFIEEKPAMTCHNQPINEYLPIEKFSQDLGHCNYPTKISCSPVNSSNPHLKVDCDVIRGVKCTTEGSYQSHGTCSFTVRITCCQCERRYHEHLTPPVEDSHYFPPPVLRDHHTMPPPKTAVYHLPPKVPEQFTEHWKPTPDPQEIRISRITKFIFDEKPVTSVNAIIRRPPIGRYPGQEPVPPTSVYRQTPGHIQHYKDSQKATTMRSRHYYIPPAQIAYQHPVPPTSVHRQKPEERLPYRQRKTYTTKRKVYFQPPIMRVTEIYNVPYTSIYKRPPGKISIHYYDTKKITTQRSRVVKPQAVPFTAHHSVPTTKVYRQLPAYTSHHYSQRKTYTTNRGVNFEVPMQQFDKRYPAPATSIYRQTPGDTHYHDERKLTTQGRAVVQPQISMVPGFQNVPATSRYKQKPRPIIHYEDSKKPTTVQSRRIPVYHHTYHDEKAAGVTSAHRYRATGRHYVEHHKVTSRPEAVNIPVRHHYYSVPKVTPRPVYLHHKPGHHYIHHRGHTTIVHYKVPYTRGVATRYVPHTTRRIHYEQHPTRQYGEDAKVPATQIVKKPPVRCEYWTAFRTVHPKGEPMETILKKVGKCQYPLALECRYARTKEPHFHSSDHITCNVVEGFKCEGKCKIYYEVRVLCCMPGFCEYSPWLTYTTSIGTPAGIDRILTDAKACIKPIELTCHLVQVHGVHKNDVSVNCDIINGAVCTLKTNPHHQNAQATCTVQVAVQWCRCAGRLERFPPKTTKAVSVPVQPRTHIIEYKPGVTRIVHHKIPERIGYHDVVKPPIPELEYYTVKRIHRHSVFVPDVTRKYTFPPQNKRLEESTYLQRDLTPYIFTYLIEKLQIISHGVILQGRSFIIGLRFLLSLKNLTIMSLEKFVILQDTFHLGHKEDIQPELLYIQDIIEVKYL